ncbi:MAG: hypothetical protein ACUVQY_04735, partial [Thermoproteota archaeon]
SMKGVKAAAAAVEIKADRSMVIAGSIHPWFASEVEGKLRASALIIEKNMKICLISCDVLMATRNDLDDVCQKIEGEIGIPFENILIAATHTHHAPATVSIHGYKKDETFCEELKEGIISAARSAENRLKNGGEVASYFWVGNESTVGQNSRLILSDNTIYWVGPRDDALRPTGPFDPDLPVMAFKRRDGGFEAFLFNHSTHNIGTRVRGACSPGFYGLAAQELEEELGGTVLFLPGAFASTHNFTLPTNEMILRIKNAIKEALSEAQPHSISQIVSAKQEFEYQVRKFDEAKEEEAVSYYCRKRLTNPEPTIEVFRTMRKELVEHQGEVRKSWLQVMLIGDIALVGVPGELFTKLGIQIKRLSPFRYTYIVALANDWIGYIPDRRAFDLGGYQVWTGFHSFIERDAGEKIVEKAVQMLVETRSKHAK